GVGGGGGAAVARLGHRKTLLLSILVQIPPIVLFAVTGEAWAFYLLASVFGFAYGAVSPLVPATVASFFGPRHIGAILGVITLAYTLGAAVGPVTAGFVFDATGSYTLTFAAAGAMLAGNFVLTLFLREPGGRGEGAV
ncbi:MAG: MFS transporter, partial [Chloroflexi bacterium]|nr:MFS transporter [Chloroflexota bacterium]